MGNKEDSVREFAQKILANKLDPSVAIHWHDRTRQLRISVLINILRKFIADFRAEPSTNEARKLAVDLLTRLETIDFSYNDPRELQKISNDARYGAVVLNSLIDNIAKLCSQRVSLSEMLSRIGVNVVNVNQDSVDTQHGRVTILPGKLRYVSRDNQRVMEAPFEQHQKLLKEIADYELRAQQIGKIVVQDPTGTRFGRLLAEHFTNIIEAASQEAPKRGIGVFKFILAKGGFCATLYEFTHKSDSSIALYSANFRDVSGLLPGVAPEGLGDAFKKYLFDNISSYLTGTLFKYSDSMSKQQNYGMLWIRATHTNDFDEVCTERRVYINTKPAKALECCRYIAATISDFLEKNKAIAQHIYFKFKIRTLLSDSDRADTCVCYLKVRKGAESLVDNVVKMIEARLAGIPDDFLNKLSSPILIKLKPGVTTIDDNVLTDPNESYTSQVGMSFFRALNKCRGSPEPRDAREWQVLAGKVIAETVDDLKRRRYPVE